MSIPQSAGAVALAFGVTVALAGFQAEAKPVSMCFKTGNGKNYVTLDKRTGYLLGKAKSCSGDAVFSVDYYNMNPAAPVRVGVPVVIKAANGRYVQFYGSRLRATAPKINPRDRRFHYLLRPSHGGIRTGTPLAANMRLNIYPLIARLRMMTAAVAGGGSDVRNLGRRNPRDPQVFFTTTGSGKPMAKKADPKVIAALQRKLAALKSAIVRYKAYAKRYQAQAKVLEKQAKSVNQRVSALTQQEKKIVAMYKQTAAQLKKASGK